MARMRKRGRRGDGTIDEITKGKKYRIRLDYGTDARGKRVRRTETVSGTYSDAQKRLNEMKAERDSGLRIDGSNMTFEEFALEFTQRRRALENLADNTLKQSESIVGILCQYLGACRLDQINTALIDRTLTAIKQDRGISNTTLKAYRTQLNLILGKAFDYSYITRNPCTRATKPKPEKSNARALEQDEIERLSESLEADWATLVGGTIARTLENSAAEEQRVHAVGLCRIGVLIALYLELLSGMRGGEAFALTWGRLDFESHAIRIEAALDNGGTLKATKNQSSTRTVPMPRHLVGKLREWRELQRHELEMIGVKQTAKTPVCCSNTGGFLDPHNARKYCREWLGEHELDVKPHWLRHTWATLLIRDGRDIRTVMALGGWSSPDVLLEIYAHESESGKREAADRLEAMVFGSLKEHDKQGEKFPEMQRI